MPIETAPYVGNLNPSNPTSGDDMGQGDDQIRLIKAALVATFPQLVAAVTATAAQLNAAAAFNPATKQDAATAVYGDTNNLGSVNALTSEGGVGANNLTRSCFFRANGEHFGSLGIHVQHANNPEYALQIAADSYGTAGNLQYRYKTAGFWGPAISIWTSNNFDPNSKQNAGTAINTSNIGSQSVAYAGSAGSVSNASSNGYGTRTVSTGTPSGGSDGDVWYQV